MKDKSSKGYHKLLIWQKAKELVLLIYKYSENFPKSEEFGLKSQLRRAVVSVVLTIVEGHRKISKKEFLHYLNMSFASLAEVEAAWELCLDLGFIDESIEKKWAFCLMPSLRVLKINEVFDVQQSLAPLLPLAL